MFARCRSHGSTLMMVGAAVLSSGSSVYAQGVGNLGQLPIAIPMNTPNGWNIASATGGPLPVVLNPQGPIWTKLFTGPNGQTLQATAGQSFTVHESLVVAGPLPWRDWHEKVVNPYWTWSNPTFLVNGATPSPLLTINNPGTLLTGGGLNFFFQAIPPGSVVDITKTLTFNAPIGTTFQGILEVRQFPTPEPASLVLLAAGAVLVNRRRRRRNVA